MEASLEPHTAAPLGAALARLPLSAAEARCRLTLEAELLRAVVGVLAPPNRATAASRRHGERSFIIFEELNNINVILAT